MSAQLAMAPAQGLIPVNDAPVALGARRHVLEVLDSGWVSSAGPMVARFERAFAEFVQFDAVAGFSQPFEIGDEFFPVGQFAVFADFETQHGFGRGNRRRRL